MLVPITCNGCRAELDQFDPNTGYLNDPDHPNRKINAAILICLCGRANGFDGRRARKKLRTLSYSKTIIAKTG